MSCQNQCLWDFEHLSICFCGCHKNKPEHVFIPWPLYTAGQAMSEFCSSLHLSGRHFEGLLTHTKIQTTGFWQRNMGTTSAAYLKMNNTSTRVIWGCRSRFMWKCQGSPAKQPPSNFKKCKSDGTTKKNGDWHSISCLWSGSALWILYFTWLLGTFAIWIRTWISRKSWFQCGANESHKHCLRKPEHMAQSFQTNPCW